MRFGCNCPDYLAREDFNLYKYAQKKRIHTLVFKILSGTYDVVPILSTVNDP